MSQNRNRSDGQATRQKEPRAARFLEGRSLTMHDACNALRFSMADALRGDITTKHANMVVGGARELRRSVETAGRLTEPTAQGMRELVINDTDQPDSAEGGNTTSEELARLDEAEQAIAARRAELMAGK